MSRSTGQRTQPLMEKLPCVSVIFLGHVDSGKSTMNGRLLLDTENFDAREMERLQKEADNQHMGSWALARVMDTYDEERARGKTMDCGYAYFKTDKRKYVLIDAPGHQGLIPRMVAASYQADVGVLLVSARNGEYEAGMRGQTREHALIAKTFGVRHLVLAINKMDDSSVNWDQARYNTCLTGVTTFLRSIGFAPSDITALPLSAYSGAGVAHDIGNLAPWYTGKNFLDTLDNLVLEPLPSDGPARMAIMDAYKEGSACVVRGKVDTGTIKQGDSLVIVPGGTSCDVVSINEDESQVPSAPGGTNVALTLRGIDPDHIDEGSVLCSPSAPMPTAIEVTAQLRVLSVSNAEGNDIPVTRGFQCIFHCHTVCDTVEIKEVVALLRFDKAAGRMVVDKRCPKGGMLSVRSGNTAVVRMRFTKPHPLATRDDKNCDRLSRFILREDQLTLGVGVITKLRGVE